jgi:hypothetical protein
MGAVAGIDGFGISPAWTRQAPTSRRYLQRVLDTSMGWRRLWRTVGEDRAGGSAHHALGHAAAEEPMKKTGPAARREDDQVTPEPPGDPGNLVGGGIPREGLRGPPLRSGESDREFGRVFARRPLATDRRSGPGHFQPSRGLRTRTQAEAHARAPTPPGRGRPGVPPDPPPHPPKRRNRSGTEYGNIHRSRVACTSVSSWRRPSKNACRILLCH